MIKKRDQALDFTTLRSLYSWSLRFYIPYTL